MSELVKIVHPKIFRPLDDKYRYKIMYGGRGCIHGDTLIDTPSGKIKVKDFEGGDIYSLSSEGVIVASACKPVMYDITPLYKIDFDNGSSLTVTEEHRFLTKTAWKKLREVELGRDLIAVACPPSSSLGIFPSGSHEGVRHYSQIVLNYLYGYLSDHHLCDAQPLLDAKTYLDVLPLLADAASHRSHALSHEDDQASSLLYNRLCIYVSRLSNYIALPFEVHTGCASSGSYSEPKTSERSLQIYLVAGQSLQKISLHELVLKLVGFFQQVSTEFLTHREENLLIIQKLLACAVDDSSYGESLVYCGKTKYTLATSITKVADDNYYDLFIPIYNNYLTDGIVNHNSGKSWVVARKLLIRGLERPVRVLCTRELQKSIKQSVHKLLSIQIEKMGLSSFYRITNEGIYGLNGTEFIFMGLKYNTDEIKSTEGVEICWIEEGESLTENSWDLIDPTIRSESPKTDTNEKGELWESEIWITYNTRFKFDAIHSLFVINKPPPDSLVIKVNYKDNKFLPKVLETQASYMRENDYDKYLNVWMGELKQLAEGAIFGKQISRVRRDNRLLYIPIEQNCETFTFWDLGKSDETAIWFMQRVGNEFRFIDYFEGRLEEVAYFARFVSSREYIYGEHYLPHDADHDRLGMSRNIKEQFEDCGINPITVVPRISSKQTAIELGREILSKCFFHLGKEDNQDDEKCDGYVAWVTDGRMATRAKRCEVGFENLSNYRYKYIDNDGVYKETPHHDKASNGADAFMQFAQSDFKDRKDDIYSDWATPINQ